MKKYLAAVLVGLLGYVAPARADELYMISDAQGTASFNSDTNQPNGYDLTGFSVASVQVCGVDGVARGVVSLQWRNTTNDDWMEIGSFADPSSGNGCQGMYGPGTGMVRAVLTYSGPGTFRVTLRRSK